MSLIVTALVMSAVAAAPRPLDRYLPCEVGLEVTYRFYRVGSTGTSTVVESVRGFEKNGTDCVIDRTTTYKNGQVESGTWVREHLPDRISDAGWKSLPAAFRTPLLRLPLRAGARWHFNTTRFEVKRVGVNVKTVAGTYECVEVSERSEDGMHVASNFYAKGLGLVLRVRGDVRREAIRVQKRR